MIFRYLLSGLLGIAGAAAISSAALLAYRTWIRQALFPEAWATFLLIAFLLLSSAEIPMMLFALRRIARAQSSVWAPLALNLAFVLTAGIYGSLYLWLTGQTREALLLTGLSVVRFLSSLLFGRPR